MRRQVRCQGAFSDSCVAARFVIPRGTGGRTFQGRWRSGRWLAQNGCTTAVMIWPPVALLSAGMAIEKPIWGLVAAGLVADGERVRTGYTGSAGSGLTHSREAGALILELNRNSARRRRCPQR